MSTAFHFPPKLELLPVGNTVAQDLVIAHKRSSSDFKRLLGFFP